MNSKHLSEIILGKTTENLIYHVRDMYVMLDSDVAFFFGIETKSLNLAMKRNINRFPSDFCFQLNSKEFKNLRLQNETFRMSTKGRKYTPYMYSEHGIITLAGTLKSDIAANASIEISRKFIEMRKTLIANSDLIFLVKDTKQELLEFKDETNKKFDDLYRWKNSNDLPKEKIIAEGHYYDAFEFITKLLHEAKESLVLVDPYCDSKAFIYLNHVNDGVAITLYKGPYSKLKNEEVHLFETQKGKIYLIDKQTLHDRFLIIDKKDCYMLGSSLNYAGKSFLAITKLNTENAKFKIINEYPGGGN